MSDRHLPTFITIGAMKGGTTALHAALAQHPDIFTTELKELDFFAEPGNWTRGPAWYREQFAGGERFDARGESSPNYTKQPEFGPVAERMAALVPDARLVYLVREPIERIRSHYQHRQGRGDPRRPFDEVATHPGFVTTSRYATQLRSFFDHFPKEQVMIVASEALRDDAATILPMIHRFIGVEPRPDVGSGVRANTAAAIRTGRFGPAADRVLRRLPGQRRLRSVYTAPLDRPGDLSPTTRRRLIELLGPEVEALARFDVVGFDGWGWLDATGRLREPEG